MNKLSLIALLLVVMWGIAAPVAPAVEGGGGVGFYMLTLSVSVEPDPGVTDPLLSFGIVEAPNADVVVVVGHDGTTGGTARLMGGQHHGQYIVSGDPAGTILVNVSAVRCSDVGLTEFLPVNDVSEITGGAGTVRVGGSVVVAPSTGLGLGSCTYNITAEMLP